MEDEVIAPINEKESRKLFKYASMDFKYIKELKINVNDLNCKLKNQETLLNTLIKSLGL